MNAKQFYDTVCKMRQAQKMYFKMRTRQHLEEAKRLEKIIDDEIFRVTAIERGKMSLFGD